MIVAIVQARMGSTRFPGKVMRPVLGKPLIDLLLRRLEGARYIDRIVLATPDTAEDRPLAEHARRLGVAVFQGSAEDVLDRYYRAALAHGAQAVVRITGDCPLVDPRLVDKVIETFRAQPVDYASNVSRPSYPDGLDVEVISMEALERAWKEAKTPLEREHVTPYIRQSDGFRRAGFSHPEDLSSERWTLDEPEDLEVIQHVFEHFAPRTDFPWEDVLALRRERPDLFEANQRFARNEGIVMGKGQKLWRRAKRVIPGGNMLLSKRAEMFLPEQWPAYFERANGCRVWDLEGREYIDMSIMGIGTNILGYGDPEVDAAVRQVVEKGNMSTLNCPEEVYLAERLIELHPWAEMVRFARSGGEANAIAIRIARAASARDKIAICGYHGWHDWYLSANLSDGGNLDGHLLPGLEPRGVPQGLRGTVFPFAYNRLDQLQSLVAAHRIGAIKMEVSRNCEPEPGFLAAVRAIATQNDIVLIFDECTSGFRETLGGLHKKYGVEPDMAMFGKALGNGYAITATIGRRAIMEAAQATFISSTFWTERIGPVAGLKTLEVMERVRSWEIVTETGLRLRKGLQELANQHGLELDQWGLPSLTGYTFRSSRALAYKTLVTQEMLAKGYLAGNSTYVCTAHTPEIVEGYLDALDPLFGLVAECESGRDVMSLLKGPICHAGFKRLN